MSNVNAAIYREILKPINQANIDREAIRRRGNMYRCPVCGVYEEWITNVHCMKEHGMSKSEVEEKFGKIIMEKKRKR